MSSAPGFHIEQASSPSLWDRVSNWVADNKAVAYTIAGTVVVVTAGGVVYYLSNNEKQLEAQKQRKSKKERRKEKKEQQEAAVREKTGEGIKLQDEEAGMTRMVRVTPNTDDFA